MRQLIKKSRPQPNERLIGDIPFFYAEIDDSGWRFLKEDLSGRNFSRGMWEKWNARKLILEFR